MRQVWILTALLMPAICNAAASAWLPFDNRDGHIAIAIKINGQPATAILDSGAEINGVAAEFLEANPDAYTPGRAVMISGAFGEMDTHLANNLQLELFGVPIEVDKVVPVLMTGADFLGGLRFFENFIVQIDYPNSRIRVIEHESMNLKDVANVRMKRQRGAVQPVVEVDVNGEKTAWLMLDTGNSGAMLMPRSLVTEFRWLERFDSIQSAAIGVTTSAELETFALPEFTIGPYTLENVIVSVPAEGQENNLGQTSNRDRSTGTRINMSKKSDGILGYDVLKHFVLTIDYKRKLMHIGVPE